ncbi:carbohydrate ABC transporter substrate-binding protein (CUT1 family) [Breoghania corrubedonensis]|uniref:Carbohydrate ABC transporter substrate-binding protein (CUT1 family) n=1 Tax=Breoghania corrubedonensis TaxID=665038 RepID=A0A2T5US51_9HYPH|nr:ABC transporter substrate-binding protein [Breoghania corrubedonensis]PTW54339.1 carbohydrate ABC transporter substrate-binding protein (CUT1 family) [Breoghania corrubedonensis]
MKSTKSNISRRALLKVGLAAPFVSALPGVISIARAAGPTKLQFMYPVGVSGDINKIISGMIADFNAQHEGIEVEAIYAGSYDNTEQKVITSIGVDTPPALWLPINSALQTFLGLDALEDITEQAKADDIYDDFLPGFLNTCISDDRLYGLPYQPSTPVLYYNKDAFAQAGLEKAPDTWDELLETAKATTLRENGELKRWGLTIGGGWHDWMFEGYCRQNGLVPWQKDKVLFDRPEAVEALQFWFKMVQEGVMPKASTWQGSANDFMAGSTAMLYHSTGSLTNLRTSSPFEVGVAFMPKKKTYGAAQGGGPLMIAKKQSDAKKEAAWTFARWMTNTENQANWSRATGYLAVRKSSWQSPAMQSYLEDVPQAKVALDQSEFAGAFLQVPGYHRVREFLKSALDRTLAGEIEAATALGEANSNANREIARVMRRRKS